MKIYVGERCSGKTTTACAKKALADNGFVMTYDEGHKQTLSELFPLRGLHGVRVCSVEDIPTLMGQNVVIDEAQFVLAELLKELYNINVIGMSIGVDENEGNIEYLKPINV